MEETKKKPRTSAAVKNRYNNKVYGSVVARLPKDLVEKFKAKCVAEGVSQAQIVKKAIEEFLNG